MSDLQCPATVIVVRHGQSEGNRSRRMSATAPGSALSPLGHEQARAVGRALRERRVARVYSSELLRAQETAAEIASEVGSDVEVVQGVHELGLGAFEGSDAAEHWASLDTVFGQWLDGDLTVGVGGDETGEQIVHRFEDALDAIADLHRGETVVVVSHGGIMGLALPRMAHVRPAVVQGRVVPNAGMVELTRDADGWQLVSWPGPTWSPAELVERVGRANADCDRLSGAMVAEVGPAVCSHLPIAHSWATRAVFTAWSEPPSPQQVRDAATWCESQAPGLWRVVVRGEHLAAVLAGAGGRLTVDQTFEVLATASLPQPPSIESLQIGEARDGEEFLRVYGAELAPLVEGRLGTAGLSFLVGRLHGEAVACARVWDVGDTAYVSAVQVLPGVRRRGLGRAMSAAATAHGLRRNPVAWLHCEPEVSPLYRALGYEPVTTHVHLTASGPDRQGPGRLVEV